MRFESQFRPRRLVRDLGARISLIDEHQPFRDPVCHTVASDIGEDVVNRFLNVIPTGRRRLSALFTREVVHAKWASKPNGSKSLPRQAARSSERVLSD